VLFALRWPTLHVCMGKSPPGDILVTIAGTSTRSPFPYDYHVSIANHTVRDVTPLAGPVLGGTPVTIHGAKFRSNASVTFVELDGSGAPTGGRGQCVWRGVPGMGCSDSTIR
jgi:hypothetical protein